MLLALSLDISAIWWLMLLLERSQATLALMGPVGLWAPAAAWRAWRVAGSADTETAAERKRAMEVSCILRGYAGIELQVTYRENVL